MASESNLTGRTGFRGPFIRVIRAVLRKLAVHENVTYGRNFRVGRGVVVSSPHGLEIGDHVSIGPRSIIQVDGMIGDFVLIGMGVQIVGRHDHAIREMGRPYVFSTWAGDRNPTRHDRVDIGRDVWIGASAVVISGIKVGEGALVAAGAVVSQDVPEYSIVAGNPAVVVGNRFDEDAQRMHRDALDALAQSLLGGHPSKRAK